MEGYSVAGVSAASPSVDQAGVGSDAAVHWRSATVRGGAHESAQIESRSETCARHSSHCPLARISAQAKTKRPLGARISCCKSRKCGTAVSAASSSAPLVGSAHTTAGCGSRHSSGFSKH
eukprot:SAG31_NODE_58_length_29669_cov_20.244978_16_plen_120_part_00